MGANFNIVSFPAMPPDMLLARFKMHQGSLRDSYDTDDYGGHLGLIKGLIVSEEGFTTFHDAKEWLIEKHSKHAPAIAVRVGDFKKSVYNKASTTVLQANISAVQKEIDTFHIGIFKRAMEGKSSLKGCSSCGSKINLKKVSPTANRLETSCPVCGGNLLVTATDAKRLVSLKEKVAKLHTTFRQLERPIDQKALPKWVIGAWCPS